MAKPKKLEKLSKELETPTPAPTPAAAPSSSTPAAAPAAATSAATAAPAAPAAQPKPAPAAKDPNDELMTKLGLKKKPTTKEVTNDEPRRRLFRIGR